MKILTALKYFVEGDEYWYEWYYFIDDTVKFLMKSFEKYRDKSPFIETSMDGMRELLEEELRYSLYENANELYDKSHSSDHQDFIRALSSLIRQSYNHCLFLTRANLEIEGVAMDGSVASPSAAVDENGDDRELRKRLNERKYPIPSIKIDPQELADHLADWGLNVNIIRSPKGKKSPVQLLDIVDINDLPPHDVPT